MDNKLSNGIAVAQIIDKRHVSAMPSVVAQRIRSLRRRRGLTVEALAAVVGVHKGHLSRVERGEKAPSVATLEAIAAALGAQMAELFGEAAAEADVLVSRRADRPTTRDGAYAVQALVPGAPGRAAALYVVEPGDAFLTQDLARHGGQEVIYVLEGEIDVAVADRIISLRAGDCAAYDASLPHRLRRRGSIRASALVIVASG